METILLNRPSPYHLEIVLNRPTKRNALSSTMIAELTEVFAALPNMLEEEPMLRAIILKAAGGVFCAGGDLAWMQQQFAAERQQRIAEAHKLATMLKVMHNAPLPLLAYAEGAAMGGGIGMLSVCDYVVAHQQCQFGLTETRLGLIPATISPYVMAKMGEGQARQIFMSGRIFKTNKALQLGLVNFIADNDDMAMNELEQELAAYRSAAPQAIRAAKKLSRSYAPLIDDHITERTITALADIWQGDEAKEGISAFFAKKTPNWHQQ